MKALISAAPSAASIRNQAGYVPLHYLLSNPLCHHEVLRAVVCAFPAPVTIPYAARRLYLLERAAKQQFPHRFTTPPPRVANAK